MRPNLKLIIDIDADIKNAQYFVKNGEFVDWFLPSDFQYVMSGKFSFSEKNKIIAEYTRRIYKINKKDILKAVDETKKRWANTENKFYVIVDKIFQGREWPKGEYIGFASIYLMYPRNIKKKTFFFPYSKIIRDPLGIIAHEMLHFIFFDFIKATYKLEENAGFTGKNPKYLWQVSETFNTVIENWKPYEEIFNTKNEKIKPYPECEKIYQIMRRQWNKKQDINEFIDQWLLKPFAK